MPYISATELIMYAPCFLRLPISSTTPVLPICHPERGRAKRCPPESKDLRLTRRFELFASHGIHQMGQPVMHHLALRLHPISLRYAPRRHVLRANQRDHLVRAERIKSQSHACPRRFGRITASPLIAANVITHLHRRLPHDILLDDAAVADDLFAVLQHYSKKAVTILAVAPLITRDPLLRIRGAKRFGIKSHRYPITNDGKDNICILIPKPPQPQPRGFEDEILGCALCFGNHLVLSLRTSTRQTERVRIEGSAVRLASANGQEPRPLVANG